MPQSKEDIKYAHTIELRFYRIMMMSLLGAIAGIAAYIATTTMTTAGELPAIKVELTTLNQNLGELKALPLEVRSNTVRINELERIAYADKR